jgi:hypothetical protein
MKTASNIVSFAAFCDTKAFSSTPPAKEIHALAATPKKLGKTSDNQGLQALIGIPGSEHFGSKSKSSSKKKTISSSHSSKSPKVMPSPGPDGFKHDCATMTATQLRLEYGSEYTSWRNRKSVCKKKNKPWDPAWNEFKDFLRDMGRKTSPADTLDRIDNDNPAYGPGLCRWADKTTQNNNKGNNVKIVVPVLGEVLTVPKLAKLHGVQPQTIYKWIAKGYSPLELLAGKKVTSLLALNTALEELPNSEATIKAKPPARKIAVPSPPNFEWNPTVEEIDHYNSTGEMLDSRYEETLAEHQEVIDWVARYNAGLPLPKDPPKWTYWRLPASLASNSSPSSKCLSKPPGPPGPSKPKGVYNKITSSPHEDDDEDEG